VSATKPRVVAGSDLLEVIVDAPRRDLRLVVAK